MPHVVRAALGGITVLQKLSHPFLSPDLPTGAYSKYCMYCKPDLYEEAWYWFDVASKPKSTESARTFLLRFSSVTPITARLDLITCAVGFIVTVVSRLAAAGTLVQKAAFVGMLELLPNSHQNKKKCSESVLIVFVGTTAGIAFSTKVYCVAQASAAYASSGYFANSYEYHK